MLTRRSVVLGGTRLLALLPVLPGLASPRTRANSRVLVVLQLTGGNDGLNTVVPWRQDDYFRVRPTLGLDPGRLHAITDDLALHPSLGGLHRLFHDGRVTIVQGVGLPEPNRSHFDSLEHWHRAGLPRSQPGWLGRMADACLAASPGIIPALHVGSDAPSPALLGRTVGPVGLDSLDDLVLRAPRGVSLAELESPRPEGSSDVAFLRSIARAAHDSVARLAATDLSERHHDYPDSELGRRLELVARLASSGLGIRLFSLTLGGFDTHARQAPTQAALLEQLSSAVAAFEADLHSRGLTDTVATLVFSEFGRRVAENGSRGTDHGAAAPILLMGGPGSGGLRGSSPALDRLVDGDVPTTTDFRALYASLERDWMGLEPSTAIPPLRL